MAENSNGALTASGRASAGTSTAPMVVASSASFSYMRANGRLLAIDKLQWSAARGKITTLIGPSGCGKSTLVRGISGILKPSAGSLHVDIPHQPSARDLTVTFQTPALLPWLTVEANAWLPFKLSNEDPTDSDHQALDHLLTTTELQLFRHCRPHELSGGMSMRAAVIRAFLPHPNLVVMDEPFAALDEVTRERMCALLEQIWMEARSTVVFVTHNLTEAVLLSDKISVLSARPGRLITELDVPFPRPRTIGLRDTSDFAAVVSELRRVVRADMNHEGY